MLRDLDGDDTMKHRNAGSAERTGATLGRALRKLLRRERRLIAWLASKGWGVTVATSAVRIAEFAVLCVLFYAAVWLALLLMFAVAAAWLARNSDDEDDDLPEWRNGVMGFGLYARDGCRIDPHDVEDEA
jgi:hypothetical protein